MLSWIRGLFRKEITIEQRVRRALRDHNILPMIEEQAVARAERWCKDGQCSVKGTVHRVVAWAKNEQRQHNARIDNDPWKRTGAR